MKIRRVFLISAKIMIYILSVILLILIINIVLNQFVFITRYQIHSKKIKLEFNNFKIIQLTDIHSIRSEREKEKLLKKLKKEKPNLICITGDLIDSKYYSKENSLYQQNKIELPEKLTINFMSELTNIAKVYYIYGNHEMILLDDPQNNIFKVSLERMGVNILNNSKDLITVGSESINILGVQDPATLYKDEKYAKVGNSHIDKVENMLYDLFEEILPEEKNRFTILLSHRPEYFELYNKYEIDLSLTGHTHGGVIVLPFIGGVYAHPQGFFPIYSGGIYYSQTQDMIVGRGIGYSVAPIRIFNPPEIVSITLKSNN